VKVSLNGILGDDFIRNLVRNLIFVDGFNAFTPVTIEYSIPNYDLKKDFLSFTGGIMKMLTCEVLIIF
jgi:hypothetical protein